MHCFLLAQPSKHPVNWHKLNSEIQAPPCTATASVRAPQFLGVITSNCVHRRVLKSYEHL